MQTNWLGPQIPQDLYCCQFPWGINMGLHTWKIPLSSFTMGKHNELSGQQRKTVVDLHRLGKGYQNTQMHKQLNIPLNTVTAKTKKVSPVWNGENVLVMQIISMFDQKKEGLHKMRSIFGAAFEPGGSGALVKIDISAQNLVTSAMRLARSPIWEASYTFKPRQK